MKQLQTPSIKARRSNMIGGQIAFRWFSFQAVCLCMKQLQTPSIKARRSNMIGGQNAFWGFFSGCLSLHEATPNTLYKSPAFEHDRGATCFLGFLSGCLSLHEATPNTLYKSPAFEHDRGANRFLGVSCLSVCLCMKQLQTPSIKARRPNMIGWQLAFRGLLALHEATPNTLYISPAFEHDRGTKCFLGFLFRVFVFA